MNILLGSDLLLYLLRRDDQVDGIEPLLRWVKLIGGTCYIDVATIAMLTRFVPTDSFGSLNYLSILKELRPKNPILKSIESEYEHLSMSGFRYKPLFAQLNWLFYNDVDYLVTDNAFTHSVAFRLNLEERVLDIEQFIEMCMRDYPELDTSKGVSITKVKFGILDYNDPFFDSFRQDYLPYYRLWFQKKAEDEVYVAKDGDGHLRGLLKLKIEKTDEDYGDIIPLFNPAYRLKICSFKAHFIAQKLGQRFMRIVFETALSNHIDEIYMTIYANSLSKDQLIGMMEQWGFRYHGEKRGESVYVRKFGKQVNTEPSYSFPYHSLKNGIYILPIYRSYAFQLLPPFGLEENELDIEPQKQAIKKVVILHQSDASMRKGSVLLFVQMSKESRNNCLIAVGIVERVYQGFNTEHLFIQRCHKRSMFPDSVLHDCWQRANEHPIVVEFLYAYYFHEFIPIQILRKIGIEIEKMRSQYPISITPIQFNKLFKDSVYAQTLVVD